MKFAAIAAFATAATAASSARSSVAAYWVRFPKRMAANGIEILMI